MAVDLYSPEAGKLRGAYQKHLGRSASDDELGGWLSGQYGGGGVDDWVNQIGQSHEAGIFRQNNPQAPPQQGWVDAQPGVQQPYQPPTGGGAPPPTSPTSPVDPGATPSAPTVDPVQQAVDRLREAYQQYLGRPASDYEVNSWLAGTFGWGYGAGDVDSMIQGISTSGEAQAYAQQKAAANPTPPPAPPPPVPPVVLDEDGVTPRRGPLGGEPAPQPAAPPPPAFQPPAPPPPEPVPVVAAPEPAPAPEPTPVPVAPVAPAATPAPVAPVAAPVAPAAPSEGGGDLHILPVDMGTPVPAPSAPTTLTDDVTNILKERLNQLRQPQDIQSDPTYQQALKAYQIQQLRGADRQRAALAERMNAEGTLNSGGFDTQVGGILERQAENEAGYAGGLALDRLASREDQLLQAIALARSVGQDDIANDLERERLALSQELGRGQLALSQKLGTGDLALREELGRGDLGLRGELGRGDLALRGELGRGQLGLDRGDLELRSRLGLSDLELRRLLGLGQLELGRGDLALRGELGRGNLGLGYDQLGQSYAEMVQRANRDAVLAAL